MIRPPRPPPINQPQPTKQQLKLYERGILNAHMNGGVEEYCCAPTVSPWRWPETLPVEAHGLYTQAEWNAFGRGLAEKWGLEDLYYVNLVIQRENERLKPVGLEWLLDTPPNFFSKQSECILTWVPYVREIYEFERANVRRVANQPVPYNLKYAWYLSTANQNRSSDLADRSLYPGLLMDSNSGVSIRLNVPPAAQQQRVVQSLPAGPASQVMVEDARVQSVANHQSGGGRKQFLNRNVIFSMHYRLGESSGPNGDKLWGFPNLPEEVANLYTRDEWSRFIGGLTPVHAQLELSINRENGRKASEGLAWRIDKLEDPIKWEFILTWIPAIRSRYEREHPTARRVSEEPPRSLKYQSSLPLSVIPSVRRSVPASAATVPKTSFPSSTSASSHPPPLEPISISSSAPSAPVRSPGEYPPMLDEPPPPAYEQVIQSLELTSSTSSSSPTQTVHMYVNSSISDEKPSSIHTVAAIPINTDNSEKPQSIPITHNQIRSGSPSSVGGDPSAVLVTAIQYCSFCGSKREPGSGPFCAVCGQRIPTHY